ncbi:hypothetical protein B0H15DRAFT_931986 [Mycena belliarum]|uniref:Short-chain dehydrogenase/reductase n=1 Tax=Mycena belliarum TaxID=1033014 RepID=A0AAD6TYY5_9AGAR|nr:hypothetical protein B0H15DRAFT_931986 [Mycena belliae]
MSLPNFSVTTTAEEVADAFHAEIHGKNVLITGTSLNGIGFESARAIAKHANLVIIAGYNPERLALSEAAIKKEFPAANIRPLIVDMASLASVRKAATEVNAYSEPLHVLIHNAAAPSAAFKLTVDNFEAQIATDHIGPFLLTKLLATKLLAAGTSSYVPRVVFVSSNAQAMGTGPDFDAIRTPPDAAKYDAMTAYAQAKSANVLTARELSKRSAGRINAYSLHPGTVYTNFHMHPDVVPLFQGYGILGSDGKPSTEHMKWKTHTQGGSTTVAAAFDTRLNDQPGVYLTDCVPAEKDVAPHSKDEKNAERLWAVTEDVIGERFAF